MRTKCRSIATFHRPIHSHWSLPLRQFWVNDVWTLQGQESPGWIRKGDVTILKGLCHEMNTFLKAYYDKYVLPVHVLIVFTIFCFLLEWKKSHNVLSILWLVPLNWWYEYFLFWKNNTCGQSLLGNMFVVNFFKYSICSYTWMCARYVVYCTNVVFLINLR